ncbi:N-acetylglucosamine-induced protein 1 [Golovinomyces cichoracearum]|uniref:N-acetylglucosamine-induced protein 1 n=1 Tax=Golovinomyces cichoracearum TaxID=62708 RepID=A0A420IEA6_9PEZI|nr:N-acetylglucosamine-induced protein 1 [Golovinomyces cichoracearum]
MVLNLSNIGDENNFVNKIAQINDRPMYLQDLGTKDEHILRIPEAEFKILEWASVRELIINNKTGNFQRRPSDLRRYLEFSHRMREVYGSIKTFLLQERLNWRENLNPIGTSFENPSDWKILCNDWPYGIENRIVHLVVWTKFPLKMNGNSGELCPDAVHMVSHFVNTTFADPLGAENVLWFKNFKSYCSVPDIEHFHIMLLDPNPEFIHMITAGDVPLYKKDP